MHTAGHSREGACTKWGQKAYAGWGLAQSEGSRQMGSGNKPETLFPGLLKTMNKPNSMLAC